MNEEQQKRAHDFYIAYCLKRDAVPQGKEEMIDMLAEHEREMLEAFAKALAHVASVRS